MEIVYRTNYRVTAEAVAEVFRRSGIRRPVGDLPRIQRMLDNANLTITAWDGERLVGIGRALTDFSFCCYLSDLAVDRDYQRQGIGRTIMDRVQQAIGEESMLLLLAAPEAMEYYPHVGFTKVENGWIINRRAG
ncbi:MAG: GNAT family N-acetyltransferase [Chloroflexi bacterium]|nr:GNAT family N-acetyltransferase [Chloroflexota bacterium]MCI0575592.1 GNAT family N-acetyltransferase [Chloroflexota bacterium]MCI0645071.1 GNAT family N-acetyltransferase [Chloroflexota bacterium]MCI0731907.1 GNAT family N-acetyltransferase [Chloroflexota bacterium]